MWIVNKKERSSYEHIIYIYVSIQFTIWKSKTSDENEYAHVSNHPPRITNRTYGKHGVWSNSVTFQCHSSAVTEMHQNANETMFCWSSTLYPFYTKHWSSHGTIISIMLHFESNGRFFRTLFDTLLKIVHKTDFSETSWIKHCFRFTSNIQLAIKCRSNRKSNTQNNWLLVGNQPKRYTWHFN